MSFIEYHLSSNYLYLGERAKGGIFKPCLKTIPFSQISGALNVLYGSEDFKAVGYLSGESGFNQVAHLIYSPRDRDKGTSKLPLRVEFLTNVSARIFVLVNNASAILTKDFEITLGGLKSKGFGRCNLKWVRERGEDEVRRGILNVRIPCHETSLFQIRNVIKPLYGYLFRPDRVKYSGEYVLSFFEGTEVVAPVFLLKEGTSG